MKTLFFLSIFTIGLFYTGTAESKVNDSLYCKCDFYSSLSRAVFERKADSIRTSFHNKYKDVVLIGMRAFTVAKLLFIVNTGNRYRGFSFDMIKMKRIELNGTEVSRMAKMLSENKVGIENSCGIVPTYISH
ncbi:MAG: hypothetical protein JWR61_3493 [Ferruginibacter sp.]|uniref:hypothetical protein n=1 Tax=Ferruginibacter sp. TaxID=1940288 RepID=UPI002659A7A8|nr:hypothetical protein [Ferruginibacter sp.]MDB5278538.1 hypothetical protein [Ferruginibacter sp.]